VTAESAVGARAAIHGCSYVLAHAPDLVRYGSKPWRDARADAGVPERIRSALRSFAAADAYLPHRVFLGAADPGELPATARPWWETAPAAAGAVSPGLVSQRQLYALLASADAFGLLAFEPAYGDRLAAEAAALGFPMAGPPGAVDPAEAEARAGAGEALVLEEDGRAVGLVRRDHGEDASLQADVLLENLAAKATGALALRRLLDRARVEPDAVPYVLGCGEEAVGDRYQRGGGSLGKAIAEQAGCSAATGADTKAFCCAPLHALAQAGALVASGVFPRVAVVGGASLAKLGMKYRGHLDAGLPILEDVLAAFAVLVGPDDGTSPVLDLQHVGLHPVGAGSAPQRIYDALVARPLAAAGLRWGDVDRYATELHNPEITEPAGSGDVPRNNYRLLAGMAVQAGEIAPGEMAAWVAKHGLVGWSPTQGHVASAVPYLGHALARMAAGREHRVMLVGKGSLFLGRMTRMADGVSVLVQA
jgi:hypothetical protein